MWDHAAEVMTACDQAVSLEPENGDLSSRRGMARALTGDFAGAIADFETYVAWQLRDGLRERAQEWLDALRAGRNPFTPEVLERLRN